jgi:hypothetical protein
MKQAERWRWPILGLALVLTSACSRQPSFLSQPENTQNRPLPFSASSNSDGISPTQAFASASIPAGTAIVVRLQSPLSSVKAHLGDQFQAILEEPIMVQGQTLAPSGTEIVGRVLAARVSEPREPGYLRLTLSSIILNGKPIDVHTSSVFSKGGRREHLRSSSTDANDIQFSTGRRLTFLLIQPLSPQG